jgi:hypothetical protein
LRDLGEARLLALALLVGAIGFAVNLLVALAVGLGLWWLSRGVAWGLRAATAER